MAPIRAMANQGINFKVSVEPVVDILKGRYLV